MLPLLALIDTVILGGAKGALGHNNRVDLSDNVNDSCPWQMLSMGVRCYS